MCLFQGVSASERTLLPCSSPACANQCYLNNYHWKDHNYREELQTFSQSRKALLVVIVRVFDQAATQMANCYLPHVIASVGHFPSLFCYCGLVVANCITYFKSQSLAFPISATCAENTKHTHLAVPSFFHLTFL